MEKYDFLDKNRKPTLKERFKRVVALALTLGTLAGFTACKTQTGKTTDTSNTIPNPPGISTMTDVNDTQPKEPIFTTIDNGTTGPEHTDPIPAEIPVAEINAFAESLKGGNFTTYAANTTRKQVGDMVELEMQGEFHKIVSLENGVNYVYDYDGTQNKWTKDFLEIPVDGPFTNSYVEVFGDTTWTSYDAQTGIVSGIWTPDAETLAQYQGAVSAENPVDFKFTEDGAELGLLGTTARIFDINRTQITLPQTYIDNTIENNNIYTVDEQGNYDFNLVLMKEVLLDWMKGNNQYQKEFMSVFSVDGVITKDVLFINASKENIEIGIITEYEGKVRFQAINIIDRNLYAGIQNQTIKSKTEMSEHLYNMKFNRVSQTISPIILDTSLSKSDFETITTNIFNHLVNVGTQSNSINEEGVKHPEYADAKVLFGFKGNSIYTIGYDMGNIYNNAMYFLIENQQKIQLVEVQVVYSGSWENVKNDTENKWLIRSVNNKADNINIENKDILPEEKFICLETYFEREMEL